MKSEAPRAKNYWFVGVKQPAQGVVNEYRKKKKKGCKCGRALSQEEHTYLLFTQEGERVAKIPHLFLCDFPLLLQMYDFGQKCKSKLEVKGLTDAVHENHISQGTWKCKEWRLDLERITRNKQHICNHQWKIVMISMTGNDSILLRMLTINSNVSSKRGFV